MERFLTISDIAQILQVSEKTITRMLQDDAMPGLKVANQWRFHPGDFRDWLDAKRRERNGIARSGIAAMLSGEFDAVPLSRLAAEDRIVRDIPPARPEEVLRLLTEPLFAGDLIEDGERFTAGLLARERMMTTGVGGGVAFPHLRHPGDQPVERPLIVMGISPQGVDWQAIDGKPVYLFVLPVTGDEAGHIRILAAFRKALAVEGIVDAFIHAASTAEVMSLLIKIEMEGSII